MQSHLTCATRIAGASRISSDTSHTINSSIPFSYLHLHIQSVIVRLNPENPKNLPDKSPHCKFRFPNIHRLGKVRYTGPSCSDSTTRLPTVVHSAAVVGSVQG